MPERCGVAGIADGVRGSFDTLEGDFRADFSGVVGVEGNGVVGGAVVGGAIVADAVILADPVPTGSEGRRMGMARAGSFVVVGVGSDVRALGSGIRDGGSADVVVEGD